MGAARYTGLPIMEVYHLCRELENNRISEQGGKKRLATAVYCNGGLHGLKRR